MTERPTGQRIQLAWASVGGRGIVGDKNLVVATLSAAGLTLQKPLLAWLCYPPMQIPWSACGPFRVEKRFLLRTRSTTFVRLPDGTTVPVRIGDAEFAQAIRSWATVEEVR